jgi:hypothetical protein
MFTKRLALLLCLLLPLPALGDSTAADPGAPAATSALQVKTLQKILSQAESNLQGALRWMGEATVSALPEERKLELYGAHSRTQRSARALIVQSSRVREASWAEDAESFVAEYFDFSQALGSLHKAVVLGEDASASLEQSRTAAQIALRRLKELKQLLERS